MFQSLNRAQSLYNQIQADVSAMVCDLFQSLNRAQSLYNIAASRGDSVSLEQFQSLNRAQSLYNQRPVQQQGRGKSSFNRSIAPNPSTTETIYHQADCPTPEFRSLNRAQSLYNRGLCGCGMC